MFFFLYRDIKNYKNSIYPRSFLCEEVKIKQLLCEIGEEAIWESRFTSFFFIVIMWTSTIST